MFTSVWASSSHRSQNSTVDWDRAEDDTQTVNINHTLMNVLKSSGHERCSSALLVYFSSGLLIFFSGLSLQMDAERTVRICVDAYHALIPGIQLSVCLLNNRWGETEKRTERETEGGIMCYLSVKATVHPKMKILPLFTHPHVVPNPYGTQKEEFEESSHSSFICLYVCQETKRIKKLHKTVLMTHTLLVKSNMVLFDISGTNKQHWFLCFLTKHQWRQTCHLIPYLFLELLWKKNLFSHKLLTSEDLEYSTWVIWTAVMMLIDAWQIWKKLHEDSSKILFLRTLGNETLRV